MANIRHRKSKAIQALKHITNCKSISVKELSKLGHLVEDLASRIHDNRLNTEKAEYYSYQLKYLMKYASGVNRQMGTPDALNALNAYMDKLTTMLAIPNTTSTEDTKNLNALYTDYHARFNVQDWADAQKYFSDNPIAKYAGTAPKLIYSYIKDGSGKIHKRTKVAGDGSFSRVKESEEQEVNDASRYLIRSGKANIRQTKQAEIALDLGAASSDLITRETLSATGNVPYKRYQVVPYLGKELFYRVQETDFTKEKQLTTSIELLLLVDSLHSGRLSQTGKRYAHGDLKLENVLINDQDQLRLIDFDFTKEDIDGSLNELHVVSTGTHDYLPIDYPPSDDRIIIHATPSYFFDDKIACFRTIFNPFFNAGIMDKQVWKNLPPSIKVVLSTTNIQAAINKDQKYTLRAAAALLIVDQYNHVCTPAQLGCQLQYVLENPIIQNELIRLYQQEDKSDLSTYIESLMNRTVREKKTTFFIQRLPAEEEVPPPNSEEEVPPPNPEENGPTPSM